MRYIILTVLITFSFTLRAASCGALSKKIGTGYYWIEGNGFSAIFQREPAVSRYDLVFDGNKRIVVDLSNALITRVGHGAEEEFHGVSYSNDAQAWLKAASKINGDLNDLKLKLDPKNISYNDDNMIIERARLAIENLVKRKMASKN